jgi:hypothetical protein
MLVEAADAPKGALDHAEQAALVVLDRALCVSRVESGYSRNTDE